MKFLGIIISNRGHRERDYLFRMSLRELKYLRRVVAVDQMLQSKVKRESGKIFKDKAQGISVSHEINLKRLL